MFHQESIFRDRHDAGRQLAASLGRFRAARPLVLALPRGGVPVAYEVARALDADLDVLLVRKIGAEGHEELGIGAVVDGLHPQVVLNEQVIDLLAPDPAYIEAETNRQLAEIERRRRVYRGDTPPIEPAERVVIVVDDGIATGGTMRAALRGVSRTGPARLVLAVPLAPFDSLANLADECDEIVCLATPTPFVAVGAHYRDFTQTTDEEVVRLLADAATWHQPPSRRADVDPSSSPSRPRPL